MKNENGPGPKAKRAGATEVTPLELDVNTVKELIQCLDKSGIDTLHLKTEAFELELERSRTAAQAGAASVPVSAKQEAAEAAKEPEGNIVKAPIVGTVYLSPSPDKPPFVTVGQHVGKGDVLFIIESMKLMNEIASDYAGVVAEIYVENGKTVEYGQPVMRIE